MKPHNLFNTDDRAVSPVIGVILMVAITVILAAVIGTFVLGLGDSLGDSQPTAQLSVDVDESGNNVTISHDGGDGIDLDDVDIVARNGSSTVGNAETISNISGVSDDRLTVGESVTLKYSGSSPGVDNIRIIYTPGDSILLDRSIEISNFSSWST